MRLEMVAARCLGTAATGLAVALTFAACASAMTGAGRASRTTAPWHLIALGIPSPPPSSLGHGQVIAVLDTGLDYEELSTLAARVIGPWNQIQQNSDVVDDNGHGTEIGVVIAGGGDRGVWGLAPGATLMPIKVADRDGRASPEAVAEGISRALALHASVINLSLATQVADPGIVRAVAAATAAGAIVVAAAGDTNQIGPEFPASEPGVVAVYAQDRSGMAAAHYNQPVGPAALAPGVDVTTLAPHPIRAEPASISGSSVAAAIISGLLADCLSTLAASGTHLAEAVLTCKARIVRSSIAPGFLDLRTITAPKS